MVQRHAGDPDLQLSQDSISNCALLLLESMLQKVGKGLKDFPNMPIPYAIDDDPVINHLIREEQSYDGARLADEVEQLLLMLNPDQQAAYAAVVHAVENHLPQSFFG